MVICPRVSPLLPHSPPQALGLSVGMGTNGFDVTAGDLNLSPHACVTMLLHSESPLQANIFIFDFSLFQYGVLVLLPIQLKTMANLARLTLLE